MKEKRPSLVMSRVCEMPASTTVVRSCSNRYCEVVLCALMSWCLLQSTSAQLKPSVSYPVSPEVATLGKFVDMPVGTYSGVPNISVPLYTMQYKSISIPLALSYHVGGIKVDEEASWVGLGWDLFSGGFISQSMIGDSEPYLDETISTPQSFDAFDARFIPGIPFNAISEYDEYVKWLCGDQVPDHYSEQESALIKDYLKRGWGQPDIYTFSFLGRSGKFIFHPITKEVIVLQKNESFRIERTGTQPQSGWRIRTADGMIFTFDVRGGGLQSQQLNTQTWKLSSITSVDGAKISFDYVGQYSKGTSVTESYKTSFFDFEGGPYSSVLTVPTENYDYYLWKIKSPTEIIEFILENRVDLRTLDDKTKRVKEIVVTDVISGKKKRSFEFEYDYFVADESGNGYTAITSSTRDAYCKRLKLKSVRTVGYDDNQEKVFSPPYRFEYNETIAFPPKSSFAVDYWGYYNGQRNNNTFLPDLIPLYLTRDEYNIFPLKLFRCPYKANRAPDSAFLQMGILKQIRFPTGGSEKFFYEPHTFSNFTIFDTKQVETLDTMVLVYDMNVPNDPQASKNIGTLTRSMQVNFDVKINPGPQGLSFDQLKFSTVVLQKKLANGSFSSPIKAWTLIDNIETRNDFNAQVAAQGYYQIALEDVMLDVPESGASYWVTANLDNRLPQQIPPASAAAVGCKISYYAAPPGNNNVFYGAGLRVARVELFDENDVLAYRKVYDYTSASVTSGKMLSSPSFVSFQKRYFTRILSDNGTTCGSYASTDLQPYLRWIVSSGSNISLAFSAHSGTIGYSKVTVKEVAVNSAATNAITEYEFFNNENIYKPDFPEVPRLDNGMPFRTTWKTGGGVILRQEDLLYQNLGGAGAFGYTVEDQSVGGSDCDNCLSPNYKIMSFRFILRRYSIPSSFYKLSSKTITDFSGNTSLSTTTSYTYNALGQLKTETTANSANDLVAKEYKYPVDYNPPTDPYPDSVVGNLRAKFFLPTIEEKYSHNAVLQKRTLNSFFYQSPGKYLAKSVSMRNKNADETDFVKYTNHSTLTGNIKEYVGKDGVNTVVLWGRSGTLPVAKIEGATIAQVNTKVNSTTLESLSPSLLRSELLKLYQLTNSMVQIFIYDDKGQMIEMIDPTLTSTFFEYDAFGRLAVTRDHNRNIVSSYQYHYIEDAH